MFSHKFGREVPILRSNLSNSFFYREEGGSRFLITVATTATAWSWELLQDVKKRRVSEISLKTSSDCMKDNTQ
jgi:hypothetical protein